MIQLFPFSTQSYKLSRQEFIQGRRIPIGAYKKEFLEFVKSRNCKKTHHNYSLALNHLERYLKEEEGVKNVQDVNMGMIDRFVSHRLECESPQRKGKTIDRSTVNTELKSIKRFFNRAVELDYINKSPARKVKLLSTVRRNPRFFSEAEVAAILDECRDEWVRDIYITLLYTGLRIGELVNLEWDDIDLIRRIVVVRPKEFWKPKGKEERSISMHDVVFYVILNIER
jgi:integrase/recombinase XerD